MIGFLLNFPKFLENTWARISEDTDLYFFLRTHTHTHTHILLQRFWTLHIISYHIISYHIIIYLRSEDPYRITNPSGYGNSQICL